jgi:hypothetical protein
MRVRPVPVLLAVFGSAAAATIFVVRQLPREGDVSAPPQAAVAAAPPETSPAVDPPAGEGDGVVEVRVTAGGEPQRGAEVRLYLAPDGPGAPWRRAGGGRTERDGTIRLPARPGAHLVAARAADLAPGLAEAVGPGRGETTRVSLALEPPAALSGRVALRGGGAVAGARVRAVPAQGAPALDPPSAPPEETASAETDATGAFRIDGLAPGAWAVSVDAAGEHPVLVRHAAVPGDPLEISLEPLGSARGRVLHADGRPAAGALVRLTSRDHGASARSAADGGYAISAPAGTYALAASAGDEAGAASVAIAAGAAADAPDVRLGPAAALHGSVVRPDGAPAAGAHVALAGHGTREVVARTDAGPDGRFEVRGLTTGAYDLRASAAGASPTSIPGITLARGTRFPLRIALSAAGAVAGTVRDPGGRALAGVRVRAVVPGDALAPAPVAEARTDFEGRFRLEGLAVGRAEVVARQEHVSIGVSAAVRIVAGGRAALDLVLPEAGDLGGLVSSGGRPAPAGTSVVAVAMTGGPAALQVARAAADARGRYHLALPAGRYRVHAAPGGSAPADLRAAPAFATVSAGETSRLDLTLTPSGPERGVEILVLEPGGAPSPGALVTLGRPDGGRIALALAAGEDGRAAIGRPAGMAGERVTVRARNGGRTGEETLALPAAGTVAVQLSPGAAVEGVLRGAAGAPFTVEVSSQPAAGSWRTLDVHHFAGGRFELADLPPEPLRLSVRAADGRRGAAEVRLAPGERRSVEIALR